MLVPADRDEHHVGRVRERLREAALGGGGRRRGTDHRYARSRVRGAAEPLRREIVQGQGDQRPQLASPVDGRGRGRVHNDRPWREPRRAETTRRGL